MNLMNRFSFLLCFLQEDDKTCMMLWAKGLTVSILRNNHWEEHDLTPATFGEGVSPKLHGSDCDQSKSRWKRLNFRFSS